MKRLAIIGGGNSGLPASYTLGKKLPARVAAEYFLYQPRPRPGGALVSAKSDGCLIEAGPDSCLTEKPWAIELCNKLGLGDQLIGSNDLDRKTYILVHGRLIEMPDGLMFMVPTKLVPTVMSPLFSPATKLRMAREWF